MFGLSAVSAYSSECTNGREDAFRANGIFNRDEEDASDRSNTKLNAFILNSKLHLAAMKVY